MAADPCSGRVLVANRLAASVSLVDPRAGTVVRTVTSQAYPNHVEVGEGGTAYVVDKSGHGPAGEDGITRIRPDAGHAPRPGKSGPRPGC
ncbi:hypothetical protein ABZ371_17595 [Streptomyces sp. NPDC005899]|uniref:hypothetical protein n=1 Tax=Streptomyces sp. NPDC005899 TaxID=3155716 RepID=UPI0033C3D4B5